MCIRDRFSICVVVRESRGGSAQSHRERPAAPLQFDAAGSPLVVAQAAAGQVKEHAFKVGLFDFQRLDINARM